MEFKGKTYRLGTRAPGNICGGCAFGEDPEGCNAAGGGCLAHGGSIWEEVPPEPVSGAAQPVRPVGDGWRESHSGQLPCGYHTRVEVVFRDGSAHTGRAGDLDWGHTGLGSDIVLFRELAEPARNNRPPVVAAAESSKPSNPKDIVGIRKAPLSCLPMNVVAEMGTAMLEGASKYGRHNFRAVGVRSSVYFDAVQRHLISWWEGEDIDPDSGMPHIVKALSCLAVLRDAQHQGLCTDDRPPISKPFYEQLNAKAGAILDKHADKSPKHYTQVPQ
jgi:hypothetical protein